MKVTLSLDSSRAHTHFEFRNIFGAGQNPVHILPLCGQCDAFVYCFIESEKENVPTIN